MPKATAFVGTWLDRGTMNDRHERDQSHVSSIGPRSEADRA
jgi:hypothetical protein